MVHGPAGVPAVFRAYGEYRRRKGGQWHKRVVCAGKRHCRVWAQVQAEGGMSR